MSIIFPLIIWVVGLIILYFIITTAVKHGINKSVVGQYFLKKMGDKSNRD